MIDTEGYSVWRQSAIGSSPFVVCAFFTQSYRNKAIRLTESLERYGLSFSIYEIPAVHNSISPSGVSDDRYSKPHFLKMALETFGKPIVYLDADMVVRESPALLYSLPSAGADVALYNWLADLTTDAWVPQAPQAAPTESPRYWRFSHACDEYSTEQLMVSGGVQYWAATDKARRLIETWEDALRTFPGKPDDECLDYAFNIAGGRGLGAKCQWLPKEYLRCGFWIYARPVLDHPDLPTAATMTNPNTLGNRRFNTKEWIAGQKARPLPRSGIVDVQLNLLLMPDSRGSLRPAASLPPLFIGDPRRWATPECS